MSTTSPGALTAPRTRRDVALPSLTGAWTAASTRRRLQIVLGLVWLVDAALQYQPFMFSRDFVTNVIEPTASGAPWIVAHPTLWAAHFMLHHIALYNTFFATFQLGIALAILYRPTAKIGLAVSAVWGLGVWWLAEGIGGIFNNASPLMGAPGAVLIYVLIALLVWPTDDGDIELSGSVAETSVLGRTPPKVAWGVLWVGLALLALETTNRAPSAIHDMIVGMESGEPGWIKAIDRAVASPFAHHGTEASIILAILYGVTALAVFSRRTAKLAVVLAALLGALTWVIQDFGTIATGNATDFNSGVPLILLAACYWPVARRANAADVS